MKFTTQQTDLENRLTIFEPYTITPFMRMTQFFSRDSYPLVMHFSKWEKVQFFVRRKGSSFTRFADGRKEKSLKLVCAMLI